MNVCHQCKNRIAEDFPVGRQAQCPFCSADLHCCRNCSFFDSGAYNDCREPQAERVLDKARSNFCDFFRFRQESTSAVTASSETKEKLEALFRKR